MLGQCCDLRKIQLTPRGGLTPDVINYSALTNYWLGHFGGSCLDIVGLMRVVCHRKLMYLLNAHSSDTAVDMCPL